MPVSALGNDAAASLGTHNDEGLTLRASGQAFDRALILAGSWLALTSDIIAGKAASVNKYTVMMSNCHVLASQTGLVVISRAIAHHLGLAYHERSFWMETLRPASIHYKLRDVSGPGTP
jgi:hypothetical protein